jgi:uncharacterized protein
MQLDLTLFRQPINYFVRTLPPGEVGGEDEAYRVTAPVDVDLQIQKEKDRFRLTGTARTCLELACSRCLESFEFPFDGAFDLRYVPVSELVHDAEHEVGGEDLDTGFYEDDQIDLNVLLREQFYLALPMKPLCKDSCRGLCARCGRNLNRERCQCTSTWEDPRLAPLKTLR